MPYKSFDYNKRNLIFSFRNSLPIFHQKRLHPCGPSIRTFILCAITRLPQRPRIWAGPGRIPSLPNTSAKRWKNERPLRRCHPNGFGLTRKMTVESIVNARQMGRIRSSNEWHLTRLHGKFWPRKTPTPSMCFPFPMRSPLRLALWWSNSVPAKCSPRTVLAFSRMWKSMWWQKLSTKYRKRRWEKSTSIIRLIDWLIDRLIGWAQCLVFTETNLFAGVYTVQGLFRLEFKDQPQNNGQGWTALHHWNDSARPRACILCHGTRQTWWSTNVLT